MNSLKILVSAGALGAAAFLGGCASEPESHLVSAPPPPAPTSPPGTVPATQSVVVTTPPQVVVTQPPAGAPVGSTSYVVTQAPPAPQPEAMPPRPSSAHVWIAGYWTWQNNRYAWMAGHWEVPPYSGAAWVNPRTESESGNFRFYEGHWN